MDGCDNIAFLYWYSSSWFSCFPTYHHTHIDKFNIQIDQRTLLTSDLCTCFFFGLERTLLTSHLCTCFFFGLERRSIALFYLAQSPETHLSSHQPLEFSLPHADWHSFPFPSSLSFCAFLSPMMHIVGSVPSSSSIARHEVLEGRRMFYFSPYDMFYVAYTQSLEYFGI